MSMKCTSNEFRSRCALLGFQLRSCSHSYVQSEYSRSIFALRNPASAVVELLFVLSLLVLLVVVDLVIPEQSLVPISKEEVSRPDVLVGVFDSLFKGR